jgi:hypothetical protein
MQRDTDNSEENYPPLHHNSILNDLYKFIWSFISHIVNCQRGNSNEDKPHNIEVNRPPMVFKYERGISS